MKLSHSIPALALAMLLPASGATIYFDDFSGASGSDLNGTAPDISPGSQTWTASTAFDFSGTNAVTATASTAVRGAYLPFTPSSGFIYTLSVTVAFASVINETRSLQLGFLELAPSGSTGTVSVASASGGPALFLRNNGTYEGRQDGGVAGFTGSMAGSAVTSNHTLKLTLDTTSTNWVMRSYMDGVEFGGGFTYTTNPSLLAVGISANTSNAVGSVGNFSNFSLTSEIPEPSAAMLGMAGLGILAGRRRRTPAVKSF